MKHVKHNPHIVFEERVDFRSSKGKFSKPYRAAYALITFPRKRKPYILDLAWLGRRSNDATISYVKDFLVEYYRELTILKFKEEEAARGKIGELKRGKLPKKFEYKVVRTESLPRTKHGEIRKVIGFNYTFKKALLMDWGNSPKMLETLGKEIARETKKLSKKFSLKEYDLYIKYFGASVYYRQTTGGLRYDLSGFSVQRTQLHDATYINPFIKMINDSYLGKLRGGLNKAGYLSRLVERVLDSKGKPILDKKGKPKYKESSVGALKVTGFRIEFSKIIG